MRQHPQLNLGIVRVHQLAPGACAEKCTQAAAQLGPHRDILQVRLGRAEPSGTGIGLIKMRMDASVRSHHLEQSIHIGGFELGELAVLQNPVDDVVLAAQRFQHLRTGGIAGLGLFSCRQTQMLHGVDVVHAGVLIHL